MATKRKAATKRRAGSPIIVDGGGRKRGRVRFKFIPSEWTFNTTAGIVTSNNNADSIKKLFVKAGTVEFELQVNNYDEIKIKFA